MSRILIVEDEVNLALGLRDALVHQGHQVRMAHDGEAGLTLAQEEWADLIVLDLMLPRLGGLEVCNELRRQRCKTPVLMLTAKDREADVVAGFEAGADDYVSKPFSVKVLIARTTALLRRCREAGEDEATPVGDTARIGDRVEIHFRRYLLIRDGKEIALTEREVALLRYLLSHSNEVVRREILLDTVWGYTSEATTRTVDTFVYRLRQKIESSPRHPRHLLTIRGVGYRLVG